MSGCTAFLENNDELLHGIVLSVYAFVQDLSRTRGKKIPYRIENQNFETSVMVSMRVLCDSSH
jgi:hypothetical protein